MNFAELYEKEKITKDKFSKFITEKPDTKINEYQEITALDIANTFAWVVIAYSATNVSVDGNDKAAIVNITDWPTKKDLAFYGMKLTDLRFIENLLIRFARSLGLFLEFEKVENIYSIKIGLK